jgi:hypothetical protein
MERCRICGNPFEELTFEHLPPSSAFNNHRTTLYGLQNWLDRSSTGEVSGGRYEQRGAGSKTLCGDCNSRTGLWYVPEYTRWAHAGVEVLSNGPPLRDLDDDTSPVMVTLRLKQVFPLRFLKQAIAMLLSVNRVDFGDENPDLRQFVLDRHTCNIPERYQTYLALYLGPKARYVGLSKTVHVENGATHFVTELAFCPFSLTLSLDERVPFLSDGNIAHFKRCSNDTPVDFDLKVLVGFGHTPLPGDFRSMAAITRDRAGTEG